MGPSFVFQAFCFGALRLQKWIKALLLVNGVATFLSVVVTVAGFILGSWIALGIWGVTFPVIMELIAIHFIRGAGPHEIHS